MAITLFNNATEEEAFYDLLAARKLRELRAEEAVYNREIDEALKKCGDILLSNGAEFNYIAELEAIETQIQEEGNLAEEANLIPQEAGEVNAS